MNKKLLQLGALLFFLAYKPFSCSALYSTHTSPTYSKKQRKQYYSHAGILPILEHNNKKYMVLGKLPGKLHFYGDFGGTQVKKDNNNPVWTAARNFSTRSNSTYEDIFALLKSQCLQTTCVLKANNGRYIIYPIEISLNNLDPLKKIGTSSALLQNHPAYGFIELSVLQKQIESLNKNAPAKDLVIKTSTGKSVTIRCELIDALLNKPSFFEKFNK
ncbi:hypothetical protein H0X48_02915 [Candidatus Dependentiae bacterium]|nr:hypothetical protein [Candidatus Dependentiae bacterium]